MMQILAAVVVAATACAPSGSSVVVGGGRTPPTAEQLARDYMFVTRTRAYMEQNVTCTARGLDELFYPIMVCK